MGHHHLKKGLIHIKTTIITLAKKLLSRKFITALAGVLGGLAMAAGLTLYQHFYRHCPIANNGALAAVVDREKTRLYETVKLFDYEIYINS